MRQIDCAVAIVVRDELILVSRRQDSDSFGGHWEFPGGKQEAGETAEQCLVRELEEEVGVLVEPVLVLPTVEHRYPNFHLRLYPFICRLADGEPRPLECQEVRWVSPAALRELRFPPANARLIEPLIEQFASYASRIRAATAREPEQHGDRDQGH